MPDLPATEPRQALAHDRVMVAEQRSPAAVAQLGGMLGGRDDVREENRREDAVGLAAAPGAGQELLDLVAT